MDVSSSSIIMLDSDSDFEDPGPPPPKRGRGNRRARGRGCARQAPKQASATTTARRSTRSSARASRGITPDYEIMMLDKENSNDSCTFLDAVDTPYGESNNKNVGSSSVTDISSSAKDSNNEKVDYNLVSDISSSAKEVEIPPRVADCVVDTPLRDSGDTSIANFCDKNDNRCESEKTSESSISTSGQACDSGSNLSNSQDVSAISQLTQCETVPPPKPALQKKGTKRGLAKKASDLSVTGTSGSSIAHNVYSKPVSIHKFLYEEQLASSKETQNEAEVPTAPVEENHVASLTEQPTTSIQPVECDVPAADSADLSDDESFMMTPEPAKQSSSKGQYARANPVPATPTVRSPTPPPPPTAKSSAVKGKKRMNKKLTQAFNALVKAQVTLNKPPVTPTRQSRQQRVSDVMIVGEESPVLKKEMVVKVRYLSKIHRINMKLTDPFHWLISRLSEELGEEEHELSLFLQDQPLSLQANPKNIELTVADIIECYCIKASEDDDISGDTINLVIQCCNRRTKVTMQARKRLPLRDVMQRYADQMSLDIGNIKFSFDGEEIDARDTPDKLEFDDDDVLDVVILGS